MTADQPQRPEPAEAADNEPRAACAHRRVLYVELHSTKGWMTNRWECDLCRTEFFPQPKVDWLVSLARAAERTETGSTVEEVTEWLGRAEGRIEDIFGLWVQGKRDERWVAEKLVGEGHLRALAAERTESRYREVIERARRTNVPAATLARRMADEDR